MTLSSEELKNTHDVKLVKTCIQLKATLENMLSILFLHYECQYALLSFSDAQFSHIPCSVCRADDAFGMPFTEKAAHFRGKSFCQLTLHRPIPVIISPICASENFGDHPLVVGEPGLTSFVGVPLVIGVKFAGALCMFWTSGKCNRSIWDYTKAADVARNISAMLECEVAAASHA